MKKMRLASAAVVLIALPQAAMAENFHGPFIGASLGHTWGDIELSYEAGTTGFDDFSEDEDISGLEAGVFAGYRHRFPSGFVLGGEFGYQRSDADGSRSGVFGANTGDVEFEKTDQFYFDLKPGYVFEENLLGYAIGGYQPRAEWEAKLVLDGTELGSEDDNFDAWRFGLGLEYMVSRDFSIRGQYHYALYNENDYPDVNGQVTKFDGDENVFTVGLTYNF